MAVLFLGEQKVTCGLVLHRLVLGFEVQKVPE
jgi:hypothetical protein